jgi:hypothetical protein
VRVWRGIAQADVLRGQSETIGQRLERDLAAMSDLPAAPFDACDQATGRVSSQALVRYKTNDYSVPVAYGHRDVWIRGYVDMVVIGCGGEVIARHPRCYDREDMVFDAVHYLPLIEQKINALDQAAPLPGPVEFVAFRARPDHHGQAFGVQRIEGRAPYAENPRRTCSQIGSCAEARWYLQNCPWGGRLDRDNDGIPCESIC